MDHLLGALSCLHKLTPPIVNGDIRPDNIKVPADRKPRLLTDRYAFDLDFGSEKADGGEFVWDQSMNYRPLEQIWNHLDPASQRVILNSYDETSAGILLRGVDPRTDLYSLAATFYHLMTGELPPDALERTISILDHKPDALLPACETNSEIPKEVSDVLTTAMALRRENRFDSAVIMQQILRAAASRLPAKPAIAAPVPQRPPVIAAESSSLETARELELKRQLTEQREREIEQERARLETERKLIEQRQVEFEAEMKRQAAEKQRLEDERARESEELERLAREAEAETERRRLEEVRQAEAERQGQLRAGGPIVDEVSIAARSEDDALLELEPSSKAPFVDESRNESIADNDEIDVPVFREQPGMGWKVPAVVVALIAIAGGGFGVWQFTSSGGQTPPVVQQAALPVEQPTVQPEASPVAAQPQPTTTMTAAEPVPPAGESDAGQSKQSRTAAKPTAEKPKVASTAKPAPQKKKLTVDDLINN
jgi:hypothetical protein